MKRFIKIISLITIMLCLIPLNSQAATTFTASSDGWFVSTSVENFGEYGTFAAGKIRWKYTDEAAKIKTWEFYLTPSANVKSVRTDLMPISLSIQNIQPGEKFLLESDTTSDNVLLIVNPTYGTTLNAGEEVLLFTVTTKDTADEGCSLSFSPQSQPKCEIVNNNYFDNSGNSVTQEEFEAMCDTKNPTVTPDKPNDVPNTPETGNYIPYVAIGGGLIAIAVLYLFTRKANKVYKI